MLRESINQLKELIMASNAELQAQLTAINDKLTEAGSEIAAELQRLKDLIEQGGGTTPETDAIVASLTEKANALAEVANAP